LTVGPVESRADFFATLSQKWRLTALTYWESDCASDQQASYMFLTVWVCQFCDSLLPQAQLHCILLGRMRMCYSHPNGRKSLLKHLGISLLSFAAAYDSLPHRSFNMTTASYQWFLTQ
jgi:hypothetical protein